MGEKSGGLSLTFVPLPDLARQGRQGKPAARSKIQERKFFTGIHDILLVEEKLVGTSMKAPYESIGKKL